jgi:hypothetical protein
MCVCVCVCVCVCYFLSSTLNVLIIFHLFLFQDLYLSFRATFCFTNPDHLDDLGISEGLI